MVNRRQSLIPETGERRGIFTISLMCLFYSLSTLEVYQFKVDSLGVVISVVQIFFFVLLLTFFIQIAMNWHRVLRIPLRILPFMFPLLLWYIIGVMGLTWTDSPFGTLKLTLVNGYRLGIMVVFFVWLSNEYQFRTLAKVVVITTVIIGIYGVMQSYSYFFLSEPITPPFIKYFNPRTRLYGYGTGQNIIRTMGFNANPSAFAMNIVIGLNMATGSAIYYYKQKKGGVGLIYLLCATFLFIVLPHTVSGSAALSFAISSVVVAIFGFNLNPLKVGLKIKKYVVKVGIALLVILVIIGVTLGPKLAVIGKIIYDQKLSSASMKYEAGGTLSDNWEITKEVLSENMLFGSGWESDAQWAAAGKLGYGVGVHAAWMLFLVETGFVGFLLQVAAFILFVRLLLYSLKIMPEKSIIYYLQMAVLASYLSFAAVGLSRQFFLMDQVSILYGLGSAIYIWAIRNAHAAE